MLRSQGSASMKEMLASIVVRVVDIGRRVHAASEPYDQPRAARAASARSLSPQSIASARLKNPRLG